MNLSFLNPASRTSIWSWSTEARLLRWLTYLWLSIGLVVLFSASYPAGNAEHQDGLYFIKRQLIGVILGLVLFNLALRLPLQFLLRVTKLFLPVLLGLIFLTLVPGLGTTTNGSTRWLAFGPFPIQPSELIKPFLVLQGAYVFGYWYKLKAKVRFTWLLVFATVLAGILLQPNLSTTALCGMTLWLIAVGAGLRFSYLATTAFGGVLLAGISMSIKEYQRKRILSFLDPWADPMGNGYQLIQSFLAVGSGGTWGSGFGLSQQKLFYLPEEHTDFIFSVFAEEFGFVGCTVLILLLLTYATLGIVVASRSKNSVSRAIATGTTILLVGQSFLNIGVATGAFPTTGVTLPFFSYGGNSTIASLMAAGLLIRVARENVEAKVVPLPNRRGVEPNRRFKVIQQPQNYAQMKRKNR
jgi:cell division protein FtsW